MDIVIVSTMEVLYRDIFRSTVQLSPAELSGDSPSFEKGLITDYLVSPTDAA